VASGEALIAGYGHARTPRAERFAMGAGHAGEPSTPLFVKGIHGTPALPDVTSTLIAPAAGQADKGGEVTGRPGSVRSAATCLRTGSRVPGGLFCVRPNGSGHMLRPEIPRPVARRIPRACFWPARTAIM
jgi:hypothetical protein